LNQPRFPEKKIHREARRRGGERKREILKDFSLWSPRLLASL
jgi:hypothetical protein